MAKVRSLQWIKFTRIKPIEGFSSTQQILLHRADEYLYGELPSAILRRESAALPEKPRWQHMDSQGLTPGCLVRVSGLALSSGQGLDRDLSFFHFDHFSFYDLW